MEYQLVLYNFKFCVRVWLPRAVCKAVDACALLWAPDSFYLLFIVQVYVVQHLD
jgi:hypothetical protein